MSNEDRFMEQPLLLEGATAPPEPAGFNPFQFAYRCLRGRIVWAVLLGLVFAVPAALVGHRSFKPQYTSVGMLEVKSSIETFIYEEGGVVPGFDRLKSTQVEYLRSRRVVDHAVRLLESRDDHWPKGIEGVQAMFNGMNVVNNRGTETIHVTFTSADRTVAKQAVNALLDAYQELYGEESDFAIGHIIRQLEQHVQVLKSEEESLNQRIRDLSSSYGTDDLEQEYYAAAARHGQIAATKQMLEDHIVTLEARGDVVIIEPGEQGDAGAIDELDLEGLPLNELAQADNELALLLMRLDGLEQSYLASSARLKPGHRTMRSLRTQIDQTAQLVWDRAIIVMESGSTPDAPAPSSLSPGRIARITDVEEARVYLNETSVRLARAEATKIEVGKNWLALDKFNDDLLRKQSELADAENKLTRKKTEEQNRTEGRIQIAQRGDLPYQPSKDIRKPLAMAGFIAGMCAGIGLIGLWGMMRLGFDFIDDFDEFRSRAPLLGVIPDLADPSSEEDSSAALSVHHLRNLLQVKHGPPQDRARIYTVSSPTSGDGKTSLTLALGISFAAIGHRTLVIDADMVASGLSRQLGLGNEPGLWEALQAGYVNGDVHETQHLGLFAMPGGSTAAAEPEKLGKERLGSLLDELGRDFDTILMDTGPLLGSLDASLAAANSDDVILAVSRGQKPRMLRAALDRLSTLGVSCAGIVFNKASWGDIRRSVSPASLNSHSMRSITPEERAKNGRKPEPRYSLGGAVAGTPQQGARRGTKT